MKIACTHSGCNKVLDSESNNEDDMDLYTSLGAGPFCSKHYEYWQSVDDRLEYENNEINN